MAKKTMWFAFELDEEIDGPLLQFLYGKGDQRKQFENLIKDATAHKLLDVMAAMHGVPTGTPSAAVDGAVTVTVKKVTRPDKHWLKTLQTA